jgi:hypothetical protein
MSNSGGSPVEEYLSTLPDKSIEITDFLRLFDDSPIVLAYIEISPRNSRTGLLKERGEWIHRFWGEAINQISNIQGCRVYWDSLFFCTNLLSKNIFAEKLNHIAIELYDTRFDVKFVVGSSGLSFNEKVSDIIKVSSFVTRIDKFEVEPGFVKSLNGDMEVY